jgi:hypothetical protein
MEYLLLQLVIWAVVAAIYTVLFSVGVKLEDHEAIAGAPPSKPEFLQESKRAA